MIQPKKSVWSAILSTLTLQAIQVLLYCLKTKKEEHNLDAFCAFMLLDNDMSYNNWLYGVAELEQKHYIKRVDNPLVDIIEFDEAFKAQIEEESKPMSAIQKEEARKKRAMAAARRYLKENGYKGL